MSILDHISHGLLSVIATFARLLLDTLDIIEGALRSLMKGVGLSSESQSLLLILLLCVFLLGALRLMKGRLRMTMSLLLILVLAHTLEHIARVGV